MSDIKRFMDTRDAKIIKAYYVLMWILFVIIFIADIIVGVKYYRLGEHIDIPFPLTFIIYTIITTPLASFLGVSLATIISGIGSRTSFLQAGIIAYINDGVKKRIRLNPNFLSILGFRVVAHSFNVYDDASFITERKVLVRYYLWLLIIYPILGVIFAVLKLFFGGGLLGEILNMLTIACGVWTIFEASPYGKLESNAKNYLRAKFDDLYIIANLTDTLLFATKYKFDPEPVRAYKINGICRELANPAVDPNAKLSSITVESVFGDYISQGRTDFPKIIADYFEYYIANSERIFAGKNCTLNCGLWECALYYLALTGRREAAVNDYNKRATYMIAPGKASRYINGSLRYQLFNEDYSVWLFDRKNMYPSAHGNFIVKWFEIPYLFETTFHTKLHELIWEKQGS
ncbi:MAG: hypothetical protein LBL98_08250 [Ruminococcus sp.]|jgi:hypothetical protein|nr:hypothetical protein [Ruminococcus sp.]